MKNSIVAAGLLFLVGCASTKMTSYVDPEFSQATYQSVLVITNIVDLEAKGLMESALCQEISAEDVKCFRAIDVFPPTRKFSDEEWLNKFFQSGAQALIAIELTDSFSTQAYIPETTTTTGNVTAYGNTAYYSQTTNTSGGYNINKPVEKYKITVLDGSNGQTVMVATSTTGGNAFAKSSDMSKSLASELANELIKHGLLPDSTANK